MSSAKRFPFTEFRYLPTLCSHFYISVDVCPSELKANYFPIEALLISGMKSVLAFCFGVELDFMEKELSAVDINFYYLHVLHNNQRYVHFYSSKKTHRCVV